MRLRVLIACERSGKMRRAFRALGHDAVSCDLEPADDGSEHHIQGDAREIIRRRWHLLIAHPVCTILCNSGVKWLYLGGKLENGPDPARRQALEQAAAFYRVFRDAGHIPMRAVENPVMHRAGIELIRRGPTQFVQPWWFGDPFFKATGFELVNLPRLTPTNKLIPPRPSTDEHKAWSMVHRASPGPDRARKRSETFPGLAAAVARQWGDFAAAFVQDRGANLPPEAPAPCQLSLL